MVSVPYFSNMLMPPNRIVVDFHVSKYGARRFQSQSSNMVNVDFKAPNMVVIIIISPNMVMVDFIAPNMVEQILQIWE